MDQKRVAKYETKDKIKKRNSVATNSEKVTQNLLTRGLDEPYGVQDFQFLNMAALGV
jgi:hypothetical protein